MMSGPLDQDIERRLSAIRPAGTMAEPTSADEGREQTQSKGVSIPRNIRPHHEAHLGPSTWR